MALKLQQRHREECEPLMLFCAEQEAAPQDVCVEVLTLCSLVVLCAGTPFADAREALRVPQEQAAAADSQRSC